MSLTLNPSHFTSTEYNKYIHNINDTSMFDVAEFINFDDIQYRNIKSSMLQELIKFKKKAIEEQSKKTISELKIEKSELEKLATYLSFQELKSFIEDNKIEINIEELNVAKFKIEKLSPIAEVNSSQSSDIDILMTRTYNVSDLDNDEIRHSYIKLGQCSPTDKLLAYIATKVKVQDSLKIIFDNKSFSYYDLDNNLICIGEEKLNLESIIAHEFGHYAIEKIFCNEIIPLNNELEIRNADFIKNAPYQDKYKIFWPKNFESLKSLLNNFYQYNSAAKPMLDLTADLILSPEERDEISSKYKYSEELVKYLKNETILPIFYFNNYKPEKEIKLELEESIKTDFHAHIITNLIINLLKLPFVKEQDYPELFTTDQKIQLECILSKILPHIIEDKDLTKEQVCYLERMGDLIHRKSDDRAAEFIVRYLEISIDNLLHPTEDSRIIDAIQPLAAFWEEHVVPKMNSTIIGCTNEYNCDASYGE